jgi:hypothetical protein
MDSYLLFNFWGLKRKVAFATSWEELSHQEVATANEIIHLRVVPFVRKKLIFLLTKANEKKGVNFLFTLLFKRLTRWMFYGTDALQAVAALSDVADNFVNQDKGITNYLRSFEVPIKVGGKKKVVLFECTFQSFESYIKSESDYLQYLKHGKLADLQSLFKTMYTANSEYDIQQVRLGYLLECLSYFSRFRNRLIKSNKGLFNKSKSGEAENINPGLVSLQEWYKIIHFMAGEDLTKYRAIESESVSKVVFNLTERQKNAEKRAQEIEKQNRRGRK